MWRVWIGRIKARVSRRNGGRLSMEVSDKGLCGGRSDGTANGNAGGQSGKTFIHTLFEGTLTNETRCLTCETVSRTLSSYQGCLQPTKRRVPTIRPPLEMNPSSIFPSISRRTRPSPPVFDSSLLARCFVRRTSFSVIPAVDCRRRRRGKWRYAS